VRGWALVPGGLIAAGVLLVVWAAIQGGAGLAIVVVVPVIYGRSLAFVAGVLLLVAGLFTLPLAFEFDDPEEPATGGGRTTGAGTSAGGLILLGPIPIFFGSWKDVSARTRLIAAVLGGAVLVAAIVVLLWSRT
jgi:uncharacterized protein (TIGR00304 family)